MREFLQIVLSYLEGAGLAEPDCGFEPIFVALGLSGVDVDGSLRVGILEFESSIMQRVRQSIST